jgi:hypothetical protein
MCFTTPSVLLDFLLLLLDELVRYPTNCLPTLTHCTSYLVRLILASAELACTEIEALRINARILGRRTRATVEGYEPEKELFQTYSCTR